MKMNNMARIGNGVTFIGDDFGVEVHFDHLGVT